MMYGIIATWCMAKEGVEKGVSLLQEGKGSSEAIEAAIMEVEDNPYYESVGYGGLPNEEMVVELDSGYMDGDTFDIGGVAALKDFANPICIAKKLSENKVNNILVGEGAEKFARKNNFEQKDILTDRAKAQYQKRRREMNQEIRPYTGHDTVGMISLDVNGKIVAGTSTSGLFMKKSGRVGDTFIVGSGFYADSGVGGAAATGLGEDLMKGCISYEIVRLMKEGCTPQKACEKAVFDLDKLLKERRKEAGDLSVVAMNNKGEFGCATNIDTFSFCVATKDLETTVYVVDKHEDGTCTYQAASREWMENYRKTSMAPVE